MAYQVISIQQESKWVYYIKNAVDYDFYHTWHYHAMDKRGEPLLFVYEEEESFIALPLIKRDISNSISFDLTSAYGYVGPISNKTNEDLSDCFLEKFKTSFLNFMHSNQYICVFSRLNPFIKQEPLLNKIGGVSSNGKTIYMDLTISLEEQRANYEKRLGRQIRQLRKVNYTIKETTEPNDIKTFTAMYNDNMHRLQADKSYFFSEEYFTEILKNNESGSKLITIFDGSQMICGAIVLYSGNIIRNHLSATSATHVNQSPSKLLTDEISVVGRKLGLKYFHLGGGVGGKEDSLFKFKASFSNLTLEDNIWRFIADKNTYDKLVEGANKNSNYFPLYRSPN
ncbi:GNAT family N-acetyltransferase [Pedobacter sp. B4-66]|uniref:GNAT family N-acetyltransferase n=1 Tax=Pedobacter sp. B4-66 TaxID=2817280 RepID=UPI001BDB37B9|nr:GNAT family N-acetyltransferase [Pedobacter sp. B4-66]